MRQVATASAQWDAAGQAAVVKGQLEGLGKATADEVGFQYRVKPEATEFTSRPWKMTEFITRTSTGEFTQQIGGLEPGKRYEFRAIVKHPLLTMNGREQTLAIPANR